MNCFFKYKFNLIFLDKKINELMYGEESRNNAISNLIFFSVLLLVVPLASVFISYQYFLCKLFNNLIFI